MSRTVKWHSQMLNQLHGTVGLRLGASQGLASKRLARLHLPAKA